MSRSVQKQRGRLDLPHASVSVRGVVILRGPVESPDGKGGVEWIPTLEAPHDHDVPVIAVESPEGALRCVIFSYACHPTSRSGTLIGGDYVCFAYDHIEAVYPDVATCFLQGCAGDQKPKPVDPTSGRFVQREVDEIRDIGVELGESVTRVLASQELRPIGGPISIVQTVLNIETEPIDMDLVTSSLDAGSEYVRAWARHLFDSVENNNPVATSFPFEIQTVRFGDALAVVGLAAEMNVEHGLRLKKELAPFFDNLMVAAYTNDIVGYIPVRRQIPEGGLRGLVQPATLEAHGSICRRYRRPHSQRGTRDAQCFKTGIIAWRVCVWFADRPCR